MSINIIEFNEEKPCNKQKTIEKRVSIVVLAREKKLLYLNDYEFEVDHTCCEKSPDWGNMIDEDDLRVSFEVILDDSSSIILMS